MSNLHEMLRNDLDRIFLDWSEAAQLVEVCREFNVSTGRMEEFRQMSELSIIRNKEQVRQAGHVSATVSLTDRVILVRDCDLPAAERLHSARLIMAGEQYEIRSVRESNWGGVVILDCVQDDVAGRNE